MTWKEFKREVEKAGVTDEMTLDAIDWDYLDREILVDIRPGVAVTVEGVS